jgi:hypothetical protein
MADSQYGGWYCKAKNADGTFCKQKVKPGEPAMQTSSPAPAPIQSSPQNAAHGFPGEGFSAGLNPTHRVALAAAALNFAGQIYVGQGQDAQGAALALADATYSAWLKATS